HPELLAPYGERFFAEVGRVWKEWTTDMAQNFAVGCYPTFQIRAETIEETERYLAEAEPPHALRRLLLEGADGIRRALRARAKDAAAACGPGPDDPESRRRPGPPPPTAARRDPARRRPPRPRPVPRRSPPG